MTPADFARASIYEAVHFAAGVRRRYREGWAQARLVAYMAAAPHCKHLDIYDVAKFTWEEASSPVETPEEKEAALERLRANVSYIENLLKKNGESNSKTAP